MGARSSSVTDGASHVAPPPPSGEMRSASGPRADADALVLLLLGPTRSRPSSSSVLLLEPHHVRPRLVEAADQLVELQLDRARVPVLAYWSSRTSRNAPTQVAVAGTRIQLDDQPKNGPLRARARRDGDRDREGERRAEKPRRRTPRSGARGSRTAYPTCVAEARARRRRRRQPVHAADVISSLSAARHLEARRPRHCLDAGVVRRPRAAACRSGAARRRSPAPRCTGSRAPGACRTC